MDRVKLEGIPYLGENTIEIENKAKSSRAINTKVYKDMLELIDNEVTSNKLVVITDNKGVWLTYMRDIRFNYRDKNVFIPYFTYKIHTIPRGNSRSNYKGHILLSDDTIDVRYEYKFNKLEINEDNKVITLYDIETDEKYNVTFENWMSNQYFDIDKLYQLYLDSCIDEEDYRLVKHTEGYHLITKSLDGIKNKEKEIRTKLELRHMDYSGEKMSILNYRDVRNYTPEQFMKAHGIPLLDIPYWKRIIDFECLLYCIFKSDAKPIGRFREQWDKLGKETSIIKYGKDIKLIFKDYWMYKHTNRAKKTWSRI